MRKHFIGKALLFLISLLTMQVPTHGGLTSSFWQKGPCGSVEKFNQTKRWEDLPGCADYENYDDENKTAMILAQTKRKFREFFTEWIVEEEFGNANTGVTFTYNTSIRNFIKEGEEARWRTDPQLVAARPAFEEMKSIVEQHLALKDSFPLIRELGSNFSSARFRTDALVKAEGKDSELADVYLKGLQEALAKVVTAGVPDSIVVTSHADRTYTLGEIKAEVSKIAGTQKASGDQFKAAEEARWRPFTSVLKGDRLMLFNKYRLILQGIGGKMLETPESFKATPIMAKYTVDESGIAHRWNMTIWRFRGDQIIATQTKSGWGSDPPSSAFR